MYSPIFIRTKNLAELDLRIANNQGQGLKLLNRGKAKDEHHEQFYWAKMQKESDEDE